MKSLIFWLSTLAVVGFTPLAAQAADLGGDDEGYVDHGPVVERPPVRDYDYYDGPAVTYYAPRFYRPYPYYADYYPYGYRYWGRPYWRAHDWGRPYWGRRGYWGGRRGWR